MEVQEIRLAGRRYPDAKISYKDNAFYVQVKIGKLDILRYILNDISKSYYYQIIRLSKETQGKYIEIRKLDLSKHIC